MNRKLQGCAVLALMAVSATASAHSWTYLGHKMMNTRDHQFRYYIDSRLGTPEGISLTAVEAATQAAFNSWENVSCAYPAFEYAGLSGSNAAITDVRDPYDAFNVSTIWVTDPGDAYYEFALSGGSVPSGAIPLSYAGYLYQCDIYLNGVRYNWTTLPDTQPSEGFIDLQTALTHEIGHCLGLADAAAPETAVMNPEVIKVGGSKRALDQHDVDHLCKYYPENGAVGSPCNASDPCTNNLTCIPYTGTGGTVLYRYCSKGCQGVDPGECEKPFVCRDSTAVPGFSKACLAVPHEAVTQVGKPCANASACGGPLSVCQPPEEQPSGGTAWLEGYCTEHCTAGPSSNSCPAGSTCTEFGEGQQDLCLKQCRLGTGDCRSGYTCSPLPEGNLCVPNCYTNADCGTGFVCRVCDRVCIENKQTGRSVGDPCTNTSECGLGQVCLFINDNPQGVCTQSCATGACSCPTGTTCRNVGAERVCMKDCAAGTCAQPLQCNPLSDGYACLPGCRSAAECPQGWSCAGGVCYDPFQSSDAGCTLCGDAGTPPPPPPPVDGGTSGGGGPGGCGCSGAPASALIFFGALTLLLLAGGRRSWPRR